jgi:hypothetical protein
LDRDAVAFTVLTGGDVVSAVYNGHGPAAGALEVDAYDATVGLISGTVTFDAEVGTEFRPYGPSARFARASFEPACAGGGEVRATEARA